MTRRLHARHIPEMGKVYDRDHLASQHIGWTYGDGSGPEGYHVEDYFDTEGRYLGADPHGIEPLFDEPFAEGD